MQLSLRLWVVFELWASCWLLMAQKICKSTIKGINGSIRVLQQGMIKWDVKDDNSVTHAILLPNSFYAPASTNATFVTTTLGTVACICTRHTKCNMRYNSKQHLTWMGSIHKNHSTGQMHQHWPVTKHAIIQELKSFILLTTIHQHRYASEHRWGFTMITQDKKKR